MNASVTRVIAEAAVLLLRMLQVLLFLRAILSWFPRGGDSALVRFLYMATEPVLMPVRTLLRRIEPLRRVPFDFSFLIVIILVEILLSLL